MSSSRRDPKKFTPPASPTASYYDLSDDDDDDEEEYSTITHTATGRGVKLLYSKSKVRLQALPRGVFVLAVVHSQCFQMSRANQPIRSTYTQHHRNATTFLGS